MHPVIMRQFAAEHIREKHAKAENVRLARQARQARRGAPSTRPRHVASETLSYDDPRLEAAQPPARHEQLSTPPVRAMVGSPPDSGAIMRREALDHCH